MAQGGVPEWAWAILLVVVLALIAWLEWSLHRSVDRARWTAAMARAQAIERELARDFPAEWEAKLKASKDAAHKALWPVDAPLDVGYKYKMASATETADFLADYPRTVEDWEIWLRAVHRAASQKTKPHDDGTFTLVPSRDFPKELLPRLREFGFRLDIMPPREER